MKTSSRPVLLVLGYVALVGGVAAWRVMLSVPDALDLGFVLGGLAAIGRDGWLAPIPWYGVPLLGDHFSPAILPLIPLAYWRWGGVGLVLVQAVSIGIAVWVTWREAVRVGLTRRTAALVSCALALHPSVLYAAFFDFHANVVAISLVAVFLAGILREEPRWSLAGGLGAASMREDVALAVVLVVLFCGARLGRRVRWMLGIGGLICLLMYAALSSRYAFGRASLFGFVDRTDPIGSLFSALAYFLDGGHVLAVLLVLAFPWVLIARLDWRILAPFVLASIPVTFGASPVGRSLAFHYYALVPVAAAFAIVSAFPDGESRLEGLREKTGWAMVLVWLAVGPLGTSALAWEYARNSVPQLVAAQNADNGRSAHLRAAVRCVSAVSPVSVSGAALPWTAGREGVYLLPQPFEPLGFVGGSGVIRIETPDLGVPVAVVSEDDTHALHRRDLNNPFVSWSGRGQCSSG